MVGAVLFALVVVLILAAGYVGLLILRRSRSAPPPAEAAEAAEAQTVGDLVRQRTGPEEEDLSGSELFTPTGPRKTAVGDAAAPGSTRADGTPAAEVALPQPAKGDVEAGDAPWRRAARMMGSEPGGAWETAPLPVVPAETTAAGTSTAAEPDGAGRTAVLAAPAKPAAPDDGDEPDDAGRTAVIPTPAPAADEVAERAEATPVPAGPALTMAAPDAVAPATAGATKTLPTPSEADEPAGSAAPAGSVETPAESPAETPAETTVETPAPEPAPEPVAADRPADDVPDTPSRPLSDPDLTPLMGIPIVRPLTSAPPASPAADTTQPDTSGPDTTQPDTSGRDTSDPAATVPTPSDAAPEDAPADLVPAAAGGSGAPAADDEVVWMQAPTPDEPSVVTGSPQPVWFRVVRRDGESVGGAVVTLLDDHGREADATKTATDGGGELHAPHGGRFLMIASAEGYQPRAALLTVDEQPVEIALLLPRSAGLTGVVRAGGAPVVGARVVAFQEGEVVDENVTGRDGGYRFADLAEGAYALSATSVQGAFVRRVTLAEGADLELDLDLVAPNRAR